MRFPKLIHVVARREITNEQTKARCERAFDSWNWLYKLGDVTPCHIWKFPRDARRVGDPRDLPFLKDALAAGLALADDPQDAVLFTNDDIIIHPAALDEMRRHMSFYPAGTMRRVDIETRPEQGGGPMPALYNPPRMFMELGWPHLGRDGFLAHAGWLKANLHRIPDFILGAPYWDLAVAAFVRICRGHKDKTYQDLYTTYADCELPDGLLIHAAHTSEWEPKPDQESSISMQYNEQLFKTWTKTYWPALTLEAVKKQEWSIRDLMRYPKYLAWKGHTVESAIPLL